VYLNAKNEHKTTPKDTKMTPKDTKMTPNDTKMTSFAPFQKRLRKIRSYEKYYVKRCGNRR
jgi:hypothetical protein